MIADADADGNADGPKLGVALDRGGASGSRDLGDDGPSQSAAPAALAADTDASAATMTPANATNGSAPDASQDALGE